MEQLEKVKEELETINDSIQTQLEEQQERTQVHTYSIAPPSNQRHASSVVVIVVVVVRIWRRNR